RHHGTGIARPREDASGTDSAMSAGKRLDWGAAKARLENAQLAIESAVYDKARIEALYRERAQALAQPDPGQIEAGDRIVVFRLGSARYGFPLENVAEVITKAKLAPA